MTVSHTAGRPAARTRWPRRLAITAAVLALLLLAADRIGVVVAQRAAAQTLQNSQDLPREPSVDIAGFPFLTQLAARDLTKVTVNAGDVPVAAAGRSLTVSRLTVVLHDITASGDLQTVRARSGTATATIGYDQLSGVLGVDLAYAGKGQDGAGRVRASKSVTVAGQQFTGSVTASIRLAQGALTFADTAASATAGGLPQPVLDALSSAFDLSVPLSGLPFGLRVRSLVAGPDGVAATFTARELVYRR